nr:ChlB [Ochrosphaera neapolitana]
MKLAYWMYSGPAHIGTLRIASSFQNVHAIMHAPLGDDYFNVMNSMLEREKNFTPVTASIVDRHVLARGSQEKVINNIIRRDMEEKPDLIILTPTCTSSILQEDLNNFVNKSKIDSSSDVLLADVNHYRVNELGACDRTLAQIVEFYLNKAEKEKNIDTTKTIVPSVNIIGITKLGFHNQHDLIELKKLFADLKINVNLVLPEDCSVHEIKNLPKAWFNFVPYREIGLRTACWLKEKFGMPIIDIAPIGLIQTAKFIKSIEAILADQGAEYFDYEAYIKAQTQTRSQSSWFARSIDCQNLTGKRAVVFGDSTHASALARILKKEMSVDVCWAGTYCTHDSDWFRNEVSSFSDEAIVTDDYNLIANLITKTEPDVIFGTQMERHIGKRLNIPCGVISSPVHIQNFPLSYRPFMGYEGSNQLADLIYNSFTLGMEDHLLEIFGGHDTKEPICDEALNSRELSWAKDALQELNKIPKFARKKVRNNTEKFAMENDITLIDLNVLYKAKESVGT